MKLVAAGLTDVGQQRDQNEDRFLLLPEFSLFMVADGMGGHRAGHVAATLAIQVIADFFKTSNQEDITWPIPLDLTKTEEENRLVIGIKLANRAIFNESVSSREYYGMGTTIVTFFYSSTQNQLYIAHVGDSRCYRIRNQQIQQLTHDHSLANYVQNMPQSPGFAREFIPKNVITRALGVQEHVQVDCQIDVPEPNDVYLLCSDGLSGMVTDQELASILSPPTEGSLDAQVQSLIRRANELGGEDNITAVAVHFQ